MAEIGLYEAMQTLRRAPLLACPAVAYSRKVIS